MSGRSKKAAPAPDPLAPVMPFVEVDGVRVNPLLAAHLRDVATLHPSPDNPNTHPERSIQAIQRSIGRWGFQKPIVAMPDGEIVAGHGRLEAAARLGWTKVPVMVFNGSRAAALAFGVADNRTAELSTWDDTNLLSSLNQIRESGLDIEEVGFQIPEFDLLLAGMEGVPDPAWVDKGAIDPDDIGDYNPEKDTFEIRVIHVPDLVKDEALARVERAIQLFGLKATIKTKVGG